MKGISYANGIHPTNRNERKSKLDRDYTRLLADDAEVPAPHSHGSGKNEEKKIKEDEDVSHERQLYFDRRRRLKELERQKLTKGKTGIYQNGNKEKEESEAGRGYTTKGDDGPSSMKGKKLPYDRRFGSFFGPSEPVVAKRIIEEARAREDAEIAATREAKATREVEQKRSAENAGKMSLQKPSQNQKPKHVEKVNEKARKLKEARDYSFLFNDLPLPACKASGKDILATSKPGVIDGRDSGKSGCDWSSSLPLRKPPAAQSESAFGARLPDKHAAFSRSLQHQCKSSQTLKSSSQAGHHHYTSEKSAAQMRPRLSSAKPMPSKMSSERPDFRKEADLKKDMMRKLVANSTTENGGKSASLDRHPPIFQSMDSCPGRPIQAAKKRFYVQPTERMPAQSTSRQMVQNPDGQRAQNPQKRTAPASAGRCRVVSEGSKKGTPASAASRPAGGGAKSRQQIPVSLSGMQNLQRKLTPKCASSQMTIDPNRTLHSDNCFQDATLGKGAPSSSKVSDGRQVARRNAMRLKGRARRPDEEDDPFIDDDDDDAGNVSTMIHKLMGYNPNKYRGNDDFDDRSMEVGFHTIQAEERRSAREARLEDERELALIEAEERKEKFRKAKKRQKLTNR